MAVRIGINGFGRMGRLVLRAAWDWPEFDFVHVNETKGGPETAAHLLKFDSVHGRWAPEVVAEDGRVRVDDHYLMVSHHLAPGDVPWDRLGVDLVQVAEGHRLATGSRESWR